MEDKGDKKDKSPNKEESNEDLGDLMMSTIRKMNGLKKKMTLPDLPINKKIQKKLLKDHSKKNKNNSENTKTYNKKPKQSNN